MGFSRGANIIRDGLVFGYDADDRSSRFYKGEPTTNLFTSYEPMVWFNSGSANISSNSTDILKPNDIMLLEYNLNILRGECTVAGSQHFGTNIISISPSTTYTFSIWFRQNRAGSNQPYLRTNVNNDSLGNFSYNGDPYSANWPINTWIRISVTATTQSNENGVYLSNYIGGAVGDIVWYYAPQLEQKSHMTQYTYGTRSTTTSLIDLKKSTTINLSNVSFGSTAHPIFDGTDDYISIPPSIIPSNAITLEFVYRNDNSEAASSVFGGGAGEQDLNVHLPWAGGTVYWDAGRPFNRIYKSVTITEREGIHHWIFTKDSSTGIMNIYLDGKLWHTGSGLTSTIPSLTSVSLGCYDAGNGRGYHTTGIIPVFKIYNKALSEAEAIQNYSAYKNRFNL